MNKNRISKQYVFLFFLLSFTICQLKAQTISRDQMIFLTSKWEGERFDDGRPMVPDDILKRMKSVSIGLGCSARGRVP